MHPSWLCQTPKINPELLGKFHENCSGLFFHPVNVRRFDETEVLGFFMELRTMPSSNCTGERSVQGFTPCRGFKHTKSFPNFHFPRREDFLGVMALMLLGKKYCWKQMVGNKESLRICPYGSQDFGLNVLHADIQTDKVHTYIHTYIHTCIHACMHACIHTYIHTCMQLCEIMH